MYEYSVEHSTRYIHEERKFIKRCENVRIKIWDEMLMCLGFNDVFYQYGYTSFISFGLNVKFQYDLTLLSMATVL